MLRFSNLPIHKSDGDKPYTDAPDSKVVHYEVGQRIYNGGDMANPSHFGTISEVRITHYGIDYKIVVDGDDEKPYWIGHCNFSQEYKGHGGTRLVTLEAYQAWRTEQLDRLNILTDKIEERT